MRMRKYGRRAPPAPGDLGRSARREGDQPVRLRDQHVQSGAMRCRIGLVRVTKIVHGVDQRLAVPVQGVDESTERVGPLRVEPEVQMEHVELIVMAGNPGRIQHHRWPPALRGTGGAIGPGIWETHYSVGSLRIGAVPNVHVAGGHGGDTHRTAWLFRKREERGGALFRHLDSSPHPAQKPQKHRVPMPHRHTRLSCVAQSHTRSLRSRRSGLFSTPPISLSVAFGIGSGSCCGYEQARPHPPTRSRSEVSLSHVCKVPPARTSHPEPMCWIWGPAAA